MLVFTHIPRTGGTSLRRFISDRLERSKSIDGITDFAFMSDKELNSYDFIATHCGYGILARIYRDSKKIIILRNPTERVISHYYYLRELPTYVSYASHYAKTMELSDFIMEKNPAVSITVENTQVWHLIEDKNLPFRQRHSGLSDHEKVDLAFDHLQQYDFVGFSDRLEVLFSDICAYYGWPLDLRLMPWLAKSHRPMIEEFEASVIEKINGKVELDMSLFQKAVRHYAV